MLIVSAFCFQNLNAQQSNAGLIEQNIYFSSGIYKGVEIVGNHRYKDIGLTIKLGYGINYYFNDYFSIFPSVAYHSDMGSALNVKDGADDDDFSFIDVPIIFQARIDAEGGGKLMLGVGPVFSFLVENDQYYIDSDPWNPLDGKDKIKNFNFSISPCLAYELKHFRIGVELQFGLIDVEKKYDNVSGEKYLNNYCLNFAYKF